MSGEASEGRPPLVRKTRRLYPTTFIERLLLMATIVLVPLQEYIPNVAGASAVWIMFAAIGGYLALNRANILNKIWNHPVFLAAYAMIAVSFLIESTHPLSSYCDIFRAGQMFVGAIFVASLCRDRRALTTAIYGYIVASLFLSVLLFFTSYGALSGVTAEDFYEASRVRNEVLGDNPLEANLNQMAFITAQGVVVALALVVTARARRRRYLLCGIMLFCLVATFLPMSRSAVAIVIVSCAAVMFTSRVKYAKTILAGGLIAATVMVLVPEAVLSRMTSRQMQVVGRVEARTAIYTAVVDTFPEYVLTGVGAGNFWGSWAFARGFIAGAHNVFAQVTINWGLVGLLALLMVIWQAYRCLPKQCENDGLALCLFGIAIALLLRGQFIHDFYAKEFALGLGVLVGARRWIWPQGVVQSATLRQRHSRPRLSHAS